MAQPFLAVLFDSLLKETLHAQRLIRCRSEDLEAALDQFSQIAADLKK